MDVRVIHGRIHDSDPVGGHLFAMNDVVSHDSVKLVSGDMSESAFEFSSTVEDPVPH